MLQAVSPLSTPMLQGHTTPAATSQLAPDGTESDSERADSDAESELDEDILYREGEMSVFDEVHHSLPPAIPCSLCNTLSSP